MLFQSKIITFSDLGDLSVAFFCQSRAVYKRTVLLYFCIL